MRTLTVAAMAFLLTGSIVQAGPFQATHVQAIPLGRSPIDIVYDQGSNRIGLWSVTLHRFVSIIDQPLVDIAPDSSKASGLTITRYGHVPKGTRQFQRWDEDSNGNLGLWSFGENRYVAVFNKERANQLTLLMKGPQKAPAFRVLRNGTEIASSDQLQAGDEVWIGKQHCKAAMVPVMKNGVVDTVSNTKVLQLINVVE